MYMTSDRPPQAPKERVTFRWNGRTVAARAGDSIAIALHGAGVRLVGRSRKVHRPLGFGGVFVAGMQAHVDGVPNCRLDRIAASAGLRVSAQNVWPCARFDLLRLARERDEARGALPEAPDADRCAHVS